MIYAPGYGDGSYRAWAESLINVMAKFRGLGDEEDNEVDAASHALRHLRDRQWAVREDERHAAEQGMRSKSQKPAQPLYPS
jgi:hypothetical protein